MVTQIEIKGEGIMFNYDNSDVYLKYPDFIFNTGDIVVLNQKSGKGKSTLINLILGLLKPKSGSIKIKYEFDDNFHYKNLISYIPQKEILLNDTIYSNITFTSCESNYNNDRLKSAFNLAGLNYLNIKYEDIFTKYCGERGQALSGGQMQRVHLARVIYENRPILIMDEPTSAIDNDGEIEILSSMKDLLSQKLTIISAHNHNVNNIKNKEYKF